VRDRIAKKQARRRQQNVSKRVHNISLEYKLVLIEPGIFGQKYSAAKVARRLVD
jgi:hypothetical protein